MNPNLHEMNVSWHAILPIHSLKKFQSVDSSSLPILDTVTLMEVHAVVPIEKQNSIQD